MINQSKILYVDDEGTNLFIFKELFKSYYQVITSMTPMEALEILEKESEIQIVISDMSMPVMNGLEFIEQAKKKFPNKHYFILTAYDINTEIASAIDNQLIKHCFQKPMDVKEISDEISNALDAA